MPTENATNHATQLAEQRTGLAVERNYLAAERTLMAWLRTSMSMISFGFTMVKMFEYLEGRRGEVVGIFGRRWAPSTVGLTLIAIGTGALVVAVLQHRRALRDLRAQGLPPGRSLALSVSVLLVALGTFAFGSLILGQ